jgi:glutamyl endopeptidase
MKATRILALIATFVFAFTLFAQAAHADEADKARGLHEAVSPDGVKTEYVFRTGKLASIEDGNLPALFTDEGILGRVEIRPNLREGAGLGVDSVIGADDRVRINPTTSYPWRAIAHLAIVRGDGSTSACTGWFIGPHTVATAGHCVFRSDRGGWNQSVTVTPGRNGNTTPFGSQVVQRSGMRSVLGWTRDGNTNFDYGAIILPNNNLGNAVGWFGFAALSDGSLNGMTANLSGYPSDKAFGTQWFHARSISSVDSRRVYYQIDTFGGQSGSPVWRYLNGQRHGVAIHTNGTGGCGGSNNCGTRIVQAVFDNLLAWKQ